MKNNYHLILTILFGISFTLKAQQSVNLSYVFSEDSIKGFDVRAAKAFALSNAFYGEEYKYVMYNEKRRFISNKYNIKPQQQSASNNVASPAVFITNNITQKTSSLLPSSGSCQNEDFEDAQTNPGAQIGGVVNGWTLSEGIGSSFASYCSPSAPNATALYTVFNTPTIDPIMIAPNNTVSSYFDANSVSQPSGNCFIRLNNSNAGAKSIKLSKSYVVGSSNSYFRYAYRAVLSNPGHACCQQPGVLIYVSVTNTTTSTTTLLACPQTSVASGTSCGPAAPGFSIGNLLNGSPSNYNSAWMPSSFDLSSYIGLLVTIDLYAVDCAASGHAGYVYFDAQCGSSVALSNSSGGIISSSNNVFNASTCGTSSITINAFPGAGPYTWGSSVIFIPSNLTVPSQTNTSLTTSQTGSLTLTMFPSGWCSPKTVTINVLSTPAPPAILQITQPTCLNSLATISLTTSSNAIVTWSPPAVTYSSNVLVSQFAGFLGNILITDTLGCSANTSYFTNPIPTSPVVNGALITPSCISPTVNLLPSVSPSNYSNLSIFYSGFPAGSLFAPSNATVSPGASTPSLNVMVDGLPGTYFFTISNTITMCSASHSFVVLPCSVTGIKNNLNENNSGLLYPNPSNGSITIELNKVEKNTVLNVFDAFGNMVLNELVNEQNQKVKLNVSKGIYFYKLNSEAGLIKQGKLIIE